MNRWIQTALEDCHAQPWANGLGLTQELMTWPQRDDWVLRVSIAHIAQSATYSVLPGTQRWHTLLKGKIELKFNHDTVRLDNQSEPYSFDGDAPCYCSLIDGPALALNTMTRGESHRTRVFKVASESFTPLSELMDLTNDERSRSTLIGLYSASPGKLKQGDNIEQIVAQQWIWSDRCTTQRIEQTSLASDCAILVLLEGVIR